MSCLFLTYSLPPNFVFLIYYIHEIIFKTLFPAVLIDINMAGIRSKILLTRDAQKVLSTLAKELLEIPAFSTGLQDCT